MWNHQILQKFIMFSTNMVMICQLLFLHPFNMFYASNLSSNYTYMYFYTSPTPPPYLKDIYGFFFNLRSFVFY